ncbi:glycosyltransferase [Anaerolineales bacterium]
MPKAVFFNLPAHGHINPSLPLVAELVKRGHKIHYFCTEAYRERVEATGASVQIYESIQDNYFDALALDGTQPHKTAQALLDTTQQILPDLLAYSREIQADYILYDCMCPWGYFVAKILDLPAISSASIMPLSPRILFNLQNLRFILPTFIKGFRGLNKAGSLSRRIGKQYQVKPLLSLEILNAPGDLIISYSSAMYVPFSQHLPDTIKMIGWTLQENEGDEVFNHRSDRPLIYVSLGTVANENKTFFQTCIQALGNSPYDVLITTGRRFSSDAFGVLPDNISIRSWVPQSQVLKQASLFITHGGMNSLHDGLYCSLPLLIVPQQSEQGFNGRRVVELGAGLMLTKDQLTVAKLKSSVEQLLSDPSYTQAARRIGDSFRSAGGIPKAADEIEQLLK